ncbi:MAG: hypothetical protein M0Z66_00240 [Thermaerobacter sp.]|nr:hypothetical protein [Thermaerobacter sp.]
MPQPQYSEFLVVAAQDTVAKLLRERGLHHLKVTSRGRHVVVYSEEADGEKVSRIRFCTLGHDQFRLDVTTHPGRWEQTPYEGPLPQLCDTALTDFSWLLAEF